MKNSLLIHHDNVVFIDFIKHRIKFQANRGDIDKYITENIIPQIKENLIDIIYIKESLSNNYLELYGLRLVYHIRLSRELGEYRLLPIVIISELDVYLLNKLTQTAKILFSKNIFITKNSKKSIEKFNNLELKNLIQNEYKENFLNQIDIEAPQESNHDISNEWAIYRWAEFLKINDSIAINDNREKIASMLYFKYLLAKNPISIKKKNGIQFVPRPPENSGKILYIDDEWAKGWSDILKRYFSKNKNIEFETFEHNFKDNNKFNTMSAIKKYCETYYPDVVLLDLRLTQSDHKTTEIETLTGIKITKVIKDINPAIQIIMLTATSQSIILENLYQHDILGYIKKEHPTDVNISTKENFDKLKELVDRGFEKRYLKEIWIVSQNILELNLSNDIKVEIKSLFEILDSDMENRFNYAMFAMVKVIEIITNIYTEEKWENKQRYALWKNSESKISSNYGKNNDSTVNKISTILDEKLFLKDSTIHKNIEEIIQTRNNTIHPKNNLNQEKISQEDIVEWFKMLQTILKKINQ